MKHPLLKSAAKRAPWIAGIALVGLLGVGAFAYTNRTNSPQQDQSTETVAVKVQDLPVSIKTNGTITPVQEVNVSPKTQSRLVRLYVDQGDQVKQGQLLARMEDEAVQAQLEQAQGGVAAAEARLSELRAGSRVEEIGQARARLAQAQARLTQARNGTRSEQILQAQAQVDAAQSQLSLTRNRSVRYRGLSQQGAISRDQLDEVLANERNAQANLQEAQRRLQELRAGSRPEEISLAVANVAELQQALRQLQNGTRPEQIAQAQAELNQAQAQVRAVQVQLADTLIRAPFNGIVTQKFASVGAFVTPTTSASSTSSATSTSIVAIAGRLEVLAKVPETDIAQIKPGQRVQVRTTAYRGETFQGKVRLIAPAAIVEQNVTSFQVRVALETGQQKLRSGMNVDLTFLGKPLQDVLVVPTLAVIMQKGQTGVLVQTGEESKFRPITLGFSTDDRTQVIDGLKEGDRVVVYTPKSNRPQRSGGGGAPPVRMF